MASDPRNVVYCPLFTKMGCDEMDRRFLRTEKAIRDLELYRRLSMDHNYDFFWDTAHRIIMEAIGDLFISPSDHECSEYHAVVDYYTYGLMAVYRRWMVSEDSMSLDDLSVYLSRISATALRIYREQHEWPEGR